MNVTRSKNLKFVYSKELEDFRIKMGFHITPGLNEIVGRPVKLRLEMLMESGIYSMWKRWEELRRVFHAPHDQEEEFVELSFDNSDVNLIFILYGICISTSLAMFLLELVLISLRGWRKLDFFRTKELAFEAFGRSLSTFAMEPKR